MFHTRKMPLNWYKFSVAIQVFALAHASIFSMHIVTKKFNNLARAVSVMFNLLLLLTLQSSENNHSKNLQQNKYK